MNGSKKLAPVILVPVLCTLVQLLDGYDLLTIGLAVPSLARQWHLPPAAFTQAFALSSIGIMVGAMIAGPVADRFGRRPMLLASVLVFGAFSLLSAFAPSLPVLVALRFLTGVGIGGAMPTTIALTADFVPERWRTVIIMFMFCGNTFGGFVAGQVGALTIPIWSWHGIFVIGGAIPLLLFPVLFVLLPESHRSHPADRNPVAGLFRRDLVSLTLLLWLVFLMNLLSLYLINYWLPTVLTLEGLAPADAAFSASLYSAGGVLSTLLLAVLLTRFRAELVLSVNVAIAVACVLLMVLGHLKGIFLDIVLLGTGAGVIGSQLGLNGFAASAYPQHLRSTGVGWALGVGRLGGIIGPILGGALLAYGFSPLSIMLFVCGPGLTTVAALLVLAWLRDDRPAGVAFAETGGPAYR
jgi:AAHS family 4-hydroxybenzoate transporter-like MFS transporter